MNKVYILFALTLSILYLCCKTKTAEEELMDSIAGGNIQKIESINKDIKNKNFLGPDGIGALHFAVQRSERNIVQKLLDLNYNVNLLDSLGRTPIFYCKDYVVGNILLNNQANTSLYDNTNSSILFSIDDVKTLSLIILKDKSIIDTKNSNGETALFDAIKRGQYAKADTLLNHNARVDIKKPNGLDVISLLKQKNDCPNQLLKRLEDINLMQNTVLETFEGNLRIASITNKIKKDIIIPPNAYKIIIKYSGLRGPSNEIIELVKTVTDKTLDKVISLIEKTSSNNKLT